MYSGAFNNFNHLSGSADPKTGTYSFTQSFGTVQANGRFGPKCDLQISYSLLSTLSSSNHTGVGRGWSFRVGSYSRESKLLTVNSGAAFKVLGEYNDIPWKLSRKLNDIQVKEVKEGGRSKLHIYHKNGDLEIMEYDTHGQNAYLTRFVSANGRYLEFEYFYKSGYNRLAGVKDSDSTLAKIQYHDNDLRVDITTHPDTPEERVSKIFYHSNGLLYNIKLPDETVDFNYKNCEHNNVILYAIDKVKYSSGAVEEMEYNERLYLPNGAPVQYTPAISMHTKKVSSRMPPIVTTFSYKKNDHNQPGRNYWGLYSGVNWKDNTDTLANYPTTYHYSSEEKCGDTVKISTYNKFHQALLTIETNGIESCQKITRYEYYSNEEEKLENQPDTYELLKKEIVTYQRSSTDVSQKFVKSYEYDKWGNVTVETQPNGIRTVSEYYPPEGVQGQCPAHPYGMVAFVKERTIHASDDSASKDSTYTYQSIPRVGGGSVVVPLAKRSGSTSKSFSYFDSSDPKTQGQLKSHSVTVGGKTTTNSCSYTFKANKVHVTDTVTGYDKKLSTSTKHTLSVWTGLTKEEINEAGVKSVYTHDKSGRMLSQTTGVGTDYELKTTYEYVDGFNDPETKANSIGTCIIQKTTGAATVHTYYDAEQRELFTYQEDERGFFRKMEEKKYDDRGRKVFESQLDYVLNDTGVEKTLTESVEYVYDCWGEESEKRHNNGTIELTLHDPIKLTTTQQVIRRDDSNHKNTTAFLSSTVVTNNKFGQPTEIKLFGKSGTPYSTTSISYDGFGRKTKVTAPTGKAVVITKYDEFDRPVEIKHYDDTTLNFSYADFTTEQLVTSVSVPSVSATLGQLQYDSLSRITSKTVNGFKTQYSYKPGQNQPSRRLNGRGQTLLFDYIPELENQPFRVASFSKEVKAEDWNDTSKISETGFKYSKKGDVHCTVGTILKASTPNSHYEYEYGKFGAAQTTKQTVGSQSNTITNQKTTMAGKPVSCNNSGRIISHEYDELGQCVSTTDGKVKAEVSLDDFGRVTNMLVKQYNEKTSLYDDQIQSTQTSYDEHSRETLRTIVVSKSNRIVSIASSYDVENKLMKRVTTVTSTTNPAASESLTESFTYDSKRRLESYDASNCSSDKLLPCNENGKPFMRQAFTFDCLDNITCIVTTFPNGDSDRATFSYDKDHKVMLKKISHSLLEGVNAYPPEITLQHDADGNVIAYKNATMSYTVSGRLSKKNDTVYNYDAFERLVKSSDTVHFYSGHRVTIETDGTNTTHFIRHGDVPVGQIQNGQNKIYGVDQKLSVVSVTEEQSTLFTTYSPFGGGDNGARIGLNGELKDKSDCSIYHLGNGARAFLTSINGFSSADSFSPFLGGGINPYIYCCGDPINAIDPSGHVSWQSIFGFVLAAVALIAVPFTGGTSLTIAIGVLGAVAGVVSSGLEIGSEIAAENGDEKLAGNLHFASKIANYVSYAFTAVGFGISIYKTGRMIKDAKNLYDYSKNKIDDAFITAFKKKVGGALKNPRKPTSADVGKAARKGVTYAKGKAKAMTFRKAYTYHRRFKKFQKYLRGDKYSGSSIARAVNTVAGDVGLCFSIYMDIKEAVDEGNDEGDEGKNVMPGSEPSIQKLVCSSHDLPVNLPFKAESLVFNTSVNFSY